MRLRKTLQLLCLLFLSSVWCNNLGSNDQHPFLDLAIRNATLHDVDVIADIILAAFDSAPHLKYMFQFKDQFPEEHLRCARIGICRSMKRNKLAIAQLVEMPSNTDPEIFQPVAMALWQYPPSSDPSAIHIAIGTWEPPQSCFRFFCKSDILIVSNPTAECLHRDANLTRAIDFENKFTRAKRSLVDNVFGSNQIYLNTLATHPDYQSRGAGTSLVRSGLDMASNYRANVTLIATEAGRPIYRHVGFKSFVNISISSVDEDADFPFDVMFYDKFAVH